MMFDVNPIGEKERSFHGYSRGSAYHFERFITRIEETKLIENIVVDQKQDLTTRRLGFCDGDGSLDGDNSKSFEGG